MKLKLALSAALFYVFNAPTAANSLIVPGQQIGDVHIGENMESVKRKLKQPTGGDAAMGHYWSFWESKTSRQPNGKPNVLGIYSGINADGSAVFVRQIRATSPYFRTCSSVSTGSSLLQVKHAFSNAQRIAYYQDSKKAPLVDIYDDVKQGIAFEFMRGGRCLAITVHRKGAKVTDNYLGDHQYHFVK